MTELHISERLRGETMPFRDLRTTRRNALLYEAASHIEKLEAALRAVIDWDNTLDWEDGPAWGDLMDIARKALEGKDDAN